MADRRPLVLVNGRVSEIPVGDTVSATVAPGGASGGGAVGLAVVTVPWRAGGSFEHEEAVVVAAATAAQRVSAWIAPGLDADENTADMLGPVVVAVTPSAGSLAFSLAFTDPASGPIKVHYQLLSAA